MCFLCHDCDNENLKVLPESFCDRPSVTVSTNLRNAETEQQLKVYVVGMNKARIVQLLIVPQDVLGAIITFLDGFVYVNWFFWFYVRNSVLQNKLHDTLYFYVFFWMPYLCISDILHVHQDSDYFEIRLDVLMDEFADCVRSWCVVNGYSWIMIDV